MLEVRGASAAQADSPADWSSKAKPRLRGRGSACRCPRRPPGGLRLNAPSVEAFPLTSHALRIRTPPSVEDVGAGSRGLGGHAGGFATIRGSPTLEPKNRISPSSVTTATSAATGNAARYLFVIGSRTKRL